MILISTVPETVPEEVPEQLPATDNKQSFRFNSVVYKKLKYIQMPA